VAYPAILVTLATDPLLTISSAIASIISGILTIYISKHLGTINRKLRFASRQEEWLSTLRELTTELSMLLEDEPDSGERIRRHLATAKPVLEAIAANAPPRSKERKELSRDAKKIGILIRGTVGEPEARDHFIRLVEITQWLTETIAASKAPEAKV